MEVAIVALQALRKGRAFLFEQEHCVRESLRSSRWIRSHGKARLIREASHKAHSLRNSVARLGANVSEFVPLSR